MALAVAQVGSNTTSGGSGGSCSFTFGSATTASSLLAIQGYTYNATAVVAGSFTDNKSNTYQLAVSNTGVAAAGVGGGYNNAGTRGATHQCTFNASGGADFNTISGCEITGQDTTNSTSCFDSTTVGTATDATTPFAVTAGAAISGSQIGIYGCMVDTGNNGTWTGPTGYTTIGSFGNGTSDNVWYGGYKIGETGTPSPSAAWNGGGVNSAKQMFMSFKSGSGGSSQALAGTSAATSTTTGALAVAHSLVGSSAGVASNSGALAVAHALVGSSAAVSTTTGALDVSTPLAGTSAGASTTTGDLVVAHALIGQSDGASATTGDLVVAHALVGSSAATSTTSGALDVAAAGINLAGQSDGASDSTGDLIVARALVGSSSALSSATGSMVEALALVGASAATASTSGALSVSSSNVPFGGWQLGSSEFYGQAAGESWNDASYDYWANF